jgi:hypothetical protein
MKDTRREREMLATFVVAGAAAVIGSYFLSPPIKRKLKVRKR